MPTVLKCACLHCGGHIEFDADAAGQEITCPHCGKQTWVDDPARFSSAKPNWMRTAEKAESEVAANHRRDRQRLYVILAVIGGIGLLILIAFLFGGTEAAKMTAQFFLIGTVSLCILGTAIYLYFLPSIIAWRGKKKNFDAIFVFNLLLSWTFFGWVLALTWSRLKAPMHE